jgi:hypothetical protein
MGRSGWVVQVGSDPAAIQDVLSQVAVNMLNGDFLAQLFEPQELYGRLSTDRTPPFAPPQPRKTRAHVLNRGIHLAPYAYVVDLPRHFTSLQTCICTWFTRLWL